MYSLTYNMRKARSRTVFLIAVGLLLGCFAWRMARPAPVKEEGHVTVQKAPPPKAEPKAQAMRTKRPVAQVVAQKPSRPASSGNAMARAEFGLYLMRPELDALPIGQREALIDLYVFCLEMRSDLRAKNITGVKRLNSDTMEVRIGAYPDLGSTLRDRFYNGAKDILGEEFYAKAMSAELKGYMESAFGCFGHMDEVLTIRKLAEPPASEMSPTYYMFQSLQAAGDEKSLEYLSDGDPAKGTAYTSTLYFNLADIADGQFSFLRPILDDKK